MTRLEKTKAQYPEGTAIMVLAAYRGEGEYGLDGLEGTHYVSGWTNDGMDLKISRSRVAALDGWWDHMVHLQRVQGSDFYDGRPLPLHGQMLNLLSPEVQAKVLAEVNKERVK